MQIENRNVAATLLLACSALLSSGCTALKLPSLSMLTKSPEPQALADPSVSSGTSSLDVYRKVREARAQNSIVLQVMGDHDALRVLPLPTDGHAVFVSTLVKQSGVQQKLGAIDVKLFRFSTESVGGLPMDVRMNEARTVVRTESDYALQPGDRLEVKKVEMLALKQLLNGALGL